MGHSEWIVTEYLKIVIKNYNKMNIKLENLEINGYHLYQDKDNFNFGIDAVLLANFALKELNIMSNTKIQICDFCTGTLPIPLMMYAKSNVKNATIKIDAFEIDNEQVTLCNKSIIWNYENVTSAHNIKEDILVYNDDIKNIFLDREKYKKKYECYDVITVNPPYNKKGSGLINANDKKVVARHEVSLTFDDICKAANLILKSNKKLYFIHQTSRLSEIIWTLKKYSFEIKKISFIHSYVDKESNLFLAEAIKNANSGIKILPPIIIYDKPFEYSKEVLKIYGK